MDQDVSRIARLVEISGAVARAALSPRGQGQADLARIGALVKIVTPSSLAFGIVNRLSMAPGDRGGEASRFMDLILLGEGTNLTPDGDYVFSRGVSVSPQLGAPVHAADSADLARIYAKPRSSCVRVGALHQDPDIPAFFVTNDLLGKHFAILGTTGSGKSCTVTVVLRAVLTAHPGGHIVLLDPHDEYARAFGDMAEIVTPDTLHLPYWLLDLEEMVHVFCSSERPYREVEANILKEAVLTAKHEFAASSGGEDYNLTIDTPTPYRMPRVLELLKVGLGRLDKPESSIPYLRLQSRVESLRRDRRFAFMFSGLTTEDSLSDILSRYLRLPASGRPLTIFNLAGVPSEIVDVVVSVLCRLIFDFALWAERGQGQPVLLVCEEAHRYVPRDASTAFGPTRLALSRIAKEGRKYGVSLGLVTQRPSEISETILSQCNTLIALRMSNEQDQDFVRRAMPENAAGLLSALPSLRTQEAVVVGEGVTVPMRIRFDDLSPDHRPASSTARFSTAWSADAGDLALIGRTIHRWRRQIR